MILELAADIAHLAILVIYLIAGMIFNIFMDMGHQDDDDVWTEILTTMILIFLWPLCLLYMVGRMALIIARNANRRLQ